MSYLLDARKLQSYSFNVDISFNAETIGTTVEIYPSSSITYTCPSGASEIIYEIDYQTAASPDDQLSWDCSRLQYSTDSGGSWSDVAGSLLMEAYDHNSHTQSHIYIMSTWAGSRMFRLAGSAYNSTAEFTFGKAQQTVSSNVALSGSCPHVSMYAVM
jgi:hypothetical protein